MRGFREFIVRDEEEAIFEASYALVRSGVDVEKLNQGLDQIILHEKNWSFNPFRTFGNAGAATAGAVLGSALGPVGTVAGGALGALAGKGIDWLTGKFMGGASIEKIKPAFDNAVQAVSKLQQLLNTTKLPNNPKMIQFKQNMDKIANNFAKFQGIDIGGQLDSHRNQELDAKLAAGGGLGGWLRSFKGTNAVSGALKWLGNKAKDIPALNTDMAFRRALAKGVDSLDDWAKENPKKAMLLNIGAGVGGAAAGAIGAHGVQNLFSRPQAKIKAPELPQGDGGGGDAAQPNNAGGAQQGGTPPQQDGTPPPKGRINAGWPAAEKNFADLKQNIINNQNLSPQEIEQQMKQAYIDTHKDFFKGPLNQKVLDIRADKAGVLAKTMKFGKDVGGGYKNYKQPPNPLAAELGY